MDPPIRGIFPVPNKPAPGRPPMPTERVTYTGRVQGVGFRYTVRTIANHHPVTGYVKNMPDGSVEIVAQGELPALNAFLADVAEKFRGNIVHCERRSEPESEAFTLFDIRY
jgi:acylphosphatase